MFFQCLRMMSSEPGILADPEGVFGHAKPVPSHDVRACVLACLRPFLDMKRHAPSFAAEAVAKVRP